MNRIEALQAAFMIAGPNVTAEEHIQYAEFLLGDQNEIILEDRISKVEDLGYTPHEFIGDYVLERDDDLYPVGAVALDDDLDVHVKVGIRTWDRYYRASGIVVRDLGAENAQYFHAVFVA